MRPRLSYEIEDIELDQITILVGYIQDTFVQVFGDDANINEWDSVRIQTEIKDIFSPEEFQRLFSSEFGRGIIVGAWIERFIMSIPLEGEENDD